MARDLAVRSVIAVCGAALAAACATKPQTPEEQAAKWLAEAPRTVAVRIATHAPASNVLVYDARMLRRLGKGAGSAVGGAVLSVGAGCMGGPLGCVVGLFLAPVGAVVGGVYGVASVESVEHHHPVKEAHGLAELLESAASPATLHALLTEAMLEEGRKAKRTALREGRAGEGEAELRLAITRLDFAGRTGEEAAGAPVIHVKAGMAVPGAEVPDWGTYVYRGRYRSLDEWRRDDAALFREELAKGMRTIAAEALARLR